MLIVMANRGSFNLKLTKKKEGKKNSEEKIIEARRNMSQQDAFVEK